MILSQTLPIYKSWVQTACPENIAHVDLVYQIAEAHYGKGGDEIVECLSPRDILDMDWPKENTKEDKDLLTEKVLAHICLKNEAALNARWGEDSDPELALR
jgi:hypothetical protein